MSTIAENLNTLSGYLVDIRNSLVDKGIIYGDESLSAFSELIDNITAETQLTPKTQTAVWLNDDKRPTYYESTDSTIRPGEYIPKTARKIIVGNDVTEIKENSFKSYSNLKEIYTGQNVLTIGQQAFLGCTSLQKITFLDDLDEIPKSACQSCHELSTVILGNQLTAINDGAFLSCFALQNIKLPDTLQEIGNGAFGRCSCLTGTINIPNNVQSIGPWAFSKCYGIDSIKLGSGLQTIGDGAFSGCSSLTGTIEIPENVSTIGTGGVFGNCTSLTEICFKGKYTSEISDLYQSYPFGAPSTVRFRGELGDEPPVLVEEPTT